MLGRDAVVRETSGYALAIDPAGVDTIVIAQLAMLPFDPKDHVATSQSVVFQVGGVIYLAGFCTLLFTLATSASG